MSTQDGDASVLVKLASRTPGCAVGHPTPPVIGLNVEGVEVAATIAVPFSLARHGQVSNTVWL